MEYQPIGYVTSCFKEKFGTPRQPLLVPEAKAILKIRADLNPLHALSGLEEFSHIWIIFDFHKNSNKQFNAKIYPPRLNGEKIGVFATRSPHRPNAVGISCAKLDGIAGDTVYISGIDIIEGTPVLDIKPYLPEFDSVPLATRGWVNRADNAALTVTFAPEAKDQLGIYDPDGSKNLLQMIFRILQLDPRNPMDREETRQNKPLGFFLSDFNVIFSVEGRVATVLKVESRREFDHRSLST
jgi:tRNA-Thr(GGU) m(6)t(6)A37 methyltransferase TsaA